MGTRIAGLVEFCGQVSMHYICRCVHYTYYISVSHVCPREAFNREKVNFNCIDWYCFGFVFQEPPKGLVFISLPSLSRIPMDAEAFDYSEPTLREKLALMGGQWTGLLEPLCNIYAANVIIRKKNNYVLL